MLFVLVTNHSFSVGQMQLTTKQTNRASECFSLFNICLLVFLALAQCLVFGFAGVPEKEWDAQ